MIHSENVCLMFVYNTCCKAARTHEPMFLPKFDISIIINIVCSHSVSG